MRSGRANWLAALRRRRRAVVCALLPAFALSATSGPACAAMLATTTSVTAEIHARADGYPAHHHAAAHADEPSVPAAKPCPHCPLESGAANAGHTSCTAVDGQDDGAIAQPISPVEPAPQVLMPNWLLPAASAAPPLIVTVAASRTPLGAPLNLRHCVLLI